MHYLDFIIANVEYISIIYEFCIKVFYEEVIEKMERKILSRFI